MQPDKADKIQELREIARSRGGELLSSVYQGSSKHLLWECELGHQWEATPENIKGNRTKKGTWCKKCGHRSGREKQLGSLEEIKRIANSKGGECLSNEYQGNHIHLTFMCSEGHDWQTTPATIKRGSWCPRCSASTRNKHRRLSLTEIKGIAHARGGKCLSEEYTNNSQNLKWECSEGHTWQAPANRIRQGGWCPKCKFSVGENICRIYFETIFQKKFTPAHKSELPWLTGKNDYSSLELDGFNQELGVAFEHHGKHHYSAGRYSSSKSDDLAIIQERDERKRTLCKLNGVKLIEIPEIGSLTKLEELGELIYKLCKEQGVLIRKEAATIRPNIDAAFKATNSNKYLLLCKIAEERGGKCLSEAFISNTTRMKWICEKGHTWESTPSNVLDKPNSRGRWCPKCATQKRAEKQRGQIRSREFAGTFDTKDSMNMLELLDAIAASQKGKLLSRKYEGDNEKMSWQCAKGHTWEASPGQIKGTRSRKGTWCPTCFETRRGASQRLSINDLKEIARQKGGKCLSENYINARTKLLWECSKGHSWEAVADTIKNRNSWCPVCARRR